MFGIIDGKSQVPKEYRVASRPVSLSPLFKKALKWLFLITSVLKAIKDRRISSVPEKWITFY